jgi:hypothetical protein
MKLKLRSTVLCVALMGLWITGTAIAGDVELWEGESSTQSITTKQIVGGSVTIENSNPGVVSVTQPKGENVTITLTGVQAGEATIRASGLVVVRNVGVNQERARSEKEFTAYISVVVVKPTTYSQKLELFEGDTASVKFSKKKPNFLLTSVFSNTRRDVCSAKKNSQKNMTIKGLEKGQSTVTLKLKVKRKKGKDEVVKGVVHVTVKPRPRWVKKRRRQIGLQVPLRSAISMAKSRYDLRRRSRISAAFGRARTHPIDKSPCTSHTPRIVRIQARSRDKMWRSSCTDSPRDRASGTR